MSDEERELLAELKQRLSMGTVGTGAERTWTLAHVTYLAEIAPRMVRVLEAAIAERDNAHRALADVTARVDRAAELIQSLATMLDAKDAAPH